MQTFLGKDERMRVGEYPFCVNLEKFGFYYDSVIAIADMSTDEHLVIQVRKYGREVALVAFHEYELDQISMLWQQPGVEVLFEYRAPKKKDHFNSSELPAPKMPRSPRGA